MPFIFDQTTRPDRLTSSKNEEYHLQMAKYCVYSSYNSDHQRWLRKIEINKRFYMNDQWFLKEDVETFLMDATGDVVNRLRMTYNTIRPMVEQYRGNAIILDINASAKSISKESVNRRDQRLAEQLLKTKVANQFPNIGEAIRSKDVTIGQDEEQTETIFENLYVDALAREINDLMDYSKRLNKFKSKQSKIALDLALAGLALQRSFFHGGHQRFENVEPEDFLFDRNARLNDLTDAEFMGTIKYMDIPTILERYQLNPDQAKTIDQYTQDTGNTQLEIAGNGNQNYTTSRLPVVTMYWKDSERYKYGWVKDEDGYESLVRIGDRKDGDLDTSPVYTEEDLITPPDTPKNRIQFPNGKKTAMLYCDVLRYCVYIPSEIASSKKRENKLPDMVLEHGQEPYQETSYQDLSNVKFPFKVYTWGYLSGEVFSPVDDIIDPQRFINRMISLTESRFNSSGGSNIVIDEDSVDDPAQAYRDIKEGKPLTVRTRGKGVPNTVGVYDATPKSGSYAMFDVVAQMKSLIQDVTGVNEGLKGESTGSEQLVGVTKLMIQRGSLMQEPFYNAISEIFLQMFESVASVGKKFYIDNERELAIAAGDESVKIFQLSKDIRNEDFLIFIERDNSDEQLKSQANQMLSVFLEMGLIDEVMFANLYERSTPTKVMADVRSYTKRKKEAERRLAEEEQAQQQQMMGQEQEMMQQAQEVQQLEKQGDKQFELEKIAAQNAGKLDQTIAKNMMTGNNAQGST